MVDTNDFWDVLRGLIPAWGSGAANGAGAADGSGHGHGRGIGKCEPAGSGEGAGLGSGGGSDVIFGVVIGAGIGAGIANGRSRGNTGTGDGAGAERLWEHPPEMGLGDGHSTGQGTHLGEGSGGRDERLYPEGSYV
jgi:hypothetical protein